MYPFLLRWPIEFPSYFTLLMVAFMIGIYLAVKEAVRVGVEANKILDMSIYILIFSILGARILHVFVDGHFDDYVNMCIDPFKVEEAAKYIQGGCKSDLMCDKAGVGNICEIATGFCYQKDCFAAIEIWRGGYVYYGGFIGGLLAGFIFIKRKKLKAFLVADIVAPSLAVGLAIGRLGCFLAGCCFGKYTSSFLGISFPSGSPAYHKHIELYPDIMEGVHNHSLTVYPTQLFSIITNGLIFVYLFFFLRKRKKYTGQIFLQFLILKSITRFIIEYFRDDDRGIFGFFSTSQWISIFIIIPAIGLSFYLKKAAKNVQ